MRLWSPIYGEVCLNVNLKRMQTSQTPSLSQSAAGSQGLTPFPAPQQVASKVDACSVNVAARACAQVAGFEALYHRLERKIVLSGKSLSTFIQDTTG